MVGKIKVITNLAARAAGSGAQLVVNIVLGRCYGASFLGEFQLFINWTFFFGYLWSLGLPTRALRLFAESNAVNSRNELRQIKTWKEFYLLRSGILILIFGLFGVGLVYIISGVYLDGSNKGVVHLFKYSAFAGILYAWLRVISDSLKGIGNTLSSFSLEFVLIQFGVSFFVIWFCFSDSVLLQGELLIAFSILVFIAVLISLAILGRNSSKIIFTKWSCKKRELFNFWAIGLVNASYAAIPYFALPWVASSEEIGFFGVAHKLVAVTSTIIAAIGAIFASAFVQYYDDGKVNQLKNIYLKAQLWTISSIGPILMVLIVFSEDILRLFGDEFIGASSILLVLAIGRLISAVFGQTEILLNMSGRANLEFRSAVISLTFFAVLLIPLSMMFGVLGVAISYSLVFILRSVVSYYFVQILFKQSLT